MDDCVLLSTCESWKAKRREERCSTATCGEKKSDHSVVLLRHLSIACEIFVVTLAEALLFPFLA